MNSDKQSFDQKIKDELESEANAIDEILNDKQGLFDLVAGSFKSGLGAWIWIVNLIILVVTGLMFWSGFEFFTANDSNAQLYWGFCTVIAVMAQIALKQWVWIEMNRASLLREIKRVEIAVVKLNAKFDK